MKKILIYNQKGGVGKTTTTTNFALILSMKGYRVLIIDTDRQGDTSRLFEINTKKQLTVAELLLVDTLTARETIYKTPYENLDIIAGNNRLVSANNVLQFRIEEMRRKNENITEMYKILANKLIDIEDDYDYCIIDSAVDPNAVTLNAFGIADEVLSPILIDSSALEGVSALFDLIKDVKQFNKKIKLKGLFLTNVVWIANIFKMGEDFIRSLPNVYVFKTKISSSVVVPESSFEKPLVKYKANSKPAKDYVKLVDEYLQLK